MKLSIITVNRNNADGLRKTIESVVSQTYTDFEYIIIDGASTDGSVDIIKEYADRITYWVSEPDIGIYNAMNKGILKAKGEYLQFLNSGDWLVDEDVIDRIYQLEQESVDIITGDWINSQEGSIFELVKSPAYYRVQKHEIISLNDLYNGTLHHPVSLIKKELFDRYGLYDEDLKIVADWFFFLKVVGLNGAKVQYVDLAIAYFDISGISSTNIDLLITERETKLKEIIPKQILIDYIYFNELECKYRTLKNRFDFLFHYPIVYNMARVFNRLIRFVNKLYCIRNLSKR